METQQPNILFILTDQQRADTIAALGNEVIKTPTLDRLTKEGVAFTRAYTPCPVCQPARAAMLTGIPPRVSGYTDNCGIPDQELTLMHRLGNLGYTTHGIGKMHFDPEWDRLWGFDSRDTSEEGPHDTDYHRFVKNKGYTHVFDPHGLRSEFYYLPQPSQLPTELHETHWVADRSIDFIKKQNQEKPFFLMSSFVKPHPPFESPNPWNRLYRTTDVAAPHCPKNPEDWQQRINRAQNRYKYMDQIGENDRLSRTIKASYYGAISFIDFQISRILEALESSGQLDNTIILFSSDHGEMMGDYGCYGKRCMLEPSMRVPMIMRFPDKKLAGQRIKTPASLLDLPSTFLDLANGDTSELTHDEGSSLLGLLDPQNGKNERIVFSQYQKGWMGHYAATDGKWKYIYSAPDKKEWLFEVTDNGLDGINQIHNPEHESHLIRLKQAMRDRFEQDGFEDVFTETGAFKAYDVPSFDADPDYGLLRQDGSQLQPAINNLPKGYQRNVTFTDKEAYKIIFDHMAS